MEQQVTQNESEAISIQELNKLVSEVSHEIRNPLGTSLTAVSHLKKNAFSALKSFNASELTKKQLQEFLESTVETIDIISLNLDRASDLIECFKRVTSNQAYDNLRVFNVRKALEDIKTTISPRLKKTKIDIAINGSDELEIRSFPGLFIQVISNLIINSLTHGFDQDDEGSISIDFDCNEDLFSLSYKDNGRGIPVEHRDKIFDEYFTTNSDGESSGLGMYIVKKIINKKMNGSIKLDSSYSQGVAFTITFPVS